MFPSREKAGLFDIQNTISLQGKIWAGSCAVFLLKVGIYYMCNIYLHAPCHLCEIWGDKNGHEHEAHALCCVVSKEVLSLTQEITPSVGIHEIMVIMIC